MGKYNRTLEELRTQAVLHWPKHLLSDLAQVSPLHKLLATQDKFLGLLKIAGKHPMAWQELLPHSDLPGNLFLKHLMILADLGGEALNKLTPLEDYFPGRVMKFAWNETKQHYTFSTQGKTALIWIAVISLAFGFILSQGYNPTNGSEKAFRLDGLDSQK